MQNIVILSRRALFSLQYARKNILVLKALLNVLK